MREQDEADGSGSTAQFRAFVDRAGGPESTQAWSMRAQRNRGAMLAVAVAGLAIVLALIAVIVIH